MITLFPDQEELVNDTRVALRKNQAVLMQAATGSGKTVCIAKMFENAVSKNKRCMMVMPRRELLHQTSNTFYEFNIQHSFVSSGKLYIPGMNAYLSTCGSLVRRLDKAPRLDLLAVDETHYGETALDTIIKHYKKQGTYIIGASATPEKLSGKGLGCWYDEMVMGKSIEWLIGNKRLSQYRLFAPDTPDMTGIKITAGDYNHAQLADKMENDRVIVGNVVEHYRNHAVGRINITFSSSRKHSEILNQAFLDAGIPSKCVDGETPDEERKKIFRALARREILNVCNCELLTFGFDLSSAAGMDVSVESISIARPTQSTALWMQILGRALRYKDQPALIFDHSSNALRLGLPDDDREWTLKDRDKRKKNEVVATEKIRQCSSCYHVHRPSPACPSCGHVYEVKAREPEQVDGQLHEVLKTKVEREDEAKKKKEWNKKLRRCKTEGELLTLAMMNGFKNPQAFADKILDTRRKWSMMI